MRGLGLGLVEVVVEKVRGTWSRWTPEVASNGKCVSIWLWTSCYFGCAIVDPINEESLCSALESVSKKWKEVASKAGFSALVSRTGAES